MTFPTAKIYSVLFVFKQEPLQICSPSKSSLYWFSCTSIDWQNKPACWRERVLSRQAFTLRHIFSVYFSFHTRRFSYECWILIVNLLYSIEYAKLPNFGSLAFCGDWAFSTRRRAELQICNSPWKRTSATLCKITDLRNFSHKYYASLRSSVTPRMEVTEVTEFIFLLRGYYADYGGVT